MLNLKKWFTRKPVAPPSMPPGVKLQTDGIRFRFVRGTYHSDTFPTAKYAASIAWHVHERVWSQDESIWKDVFPIPPTL